MIDLHLHTNASDGRCSPRELVERTATAGLSVISVVDHDTFAAQEDVAAAAAGVGIRTVTGIEITAVWQGSDVHVLGYYLDPASPRLSEFLAHQREDRVRRVHAILERLAALGLRITFEQVATAEGQPVPNAIGRPQIARALVRAGHVADVRDAFDEYLAEGRPGFVPRIGAVPGEVVRLIVEAGGVASLAHPGLLRRDELIPGLVDAGMQAIEVYHTDHPPDVVRHYVAVSSRFGLVATGGSDYHAEQTHGAAVLGRVTLPACDFDRLEALAQRLGRAW